MKRVILGIEQLVNEQKKSVQGRRIGLLAHPASIGADFQHSLALLVQSGAHVTILFGPEHGFGGEAQDMEPVGDGNIDQRSIPLISLYGQTEESLAPSKEALGGLDALVVDLSDVGSRYYTFVWTALLCLRVCHQAGIEMILTDRPNPLGGERVEGAPQEEDFLSFVGLFPVSNRHGLTPGELVSLAAEKEGIRDALTVVQMKGWQRSMMFDQTRLPWVMPSPNMPTVDTALVYPGLCLLESTWASEGRGTTRPFELVGAPEIDSQGLAAKLRKMNLPGVAFRPCSFKPGFQKHANHICNGVQLHVTDASRFLPYRTGVALLVALKAEAGSGFKWRDQPYEFVTDRPAIDLLAGTTEVRLAIEQGASIDEIGETWKQGETEFTTFRRQFFLY